MRVLNFDGTAGPLYERSDAPRLSDQHLRIKALMLDGKWRTLAEIRIATGYPEASISAQLRHLRKDRFGGHRVDPRKRSGGTWEYRVGPPDLFAQRRYQDLKADYSAALARLVLAVLS